MLKTFLLLSAALLFGSAQTPSPAPVQENVPQETTPAATNPVKFTAAGRERAKKLYDVDCLMCHGAKGNGKTDLANDMGLTLPDFTDPKVLAAMPDQTLFNAIRNGKDKMPAEAEGRASDHDVWELVLYIRSMAKE